MLQFLEIEIETFQKDAKKFYKMLYFCTSEKVNFLN